MGTGLGRIGIAGVNRLMAPLGLQLGPLMRLGIDFEVRPKGHALDRMCADLGDCFSSWASTQSVWDLEAPSESSRMVRDFYERYLESPFRGNSGGSRFNNLLWLYLLARALKPDTIVDSGTFTGASAWSLALGAPDATVLSFDLTLSHLRRKHPGVRYREADWMTEDWGSHNLGKVLCYFDDHVDQSRRLFEASSLGIRYLIFDDDYPCTSFWQMAHGGAALPKISFVVDEALQSVAELEWESGGSRCAFRIDPVAFAKARAAMAAWDRLPNTSLVTGIHQTPYRLVRVV